MTFTRFMPEQTPKVVEQLIFATVVVSIGSALWESLFTHLLGLPPLQDLLGLSVWGIKHFFIWQFISYIFVLNSYGAGITFFYLFVLFLTMYILWILGGAIYDFAGRKQFLQLYFLSGISAGIVGILMLLIMGYDTQFAGPTPPLLALFTVWCFIHPEDELRLFFFLPMKAKWLFAGIVGAILLVGIAQFNIVDLLFYLTGIYTGYIFSLLAWELRSPFSWTHAWDAKLIEMGRRFREKRAKLRNKSSSKIVNFLTGEPELNDNDFIDAMLNKISTHGTESLTRAEKKRMDDISKKRPVK